MYGVKITRQRYTRTSRDEQGEKGTKGLDSKLAFGPL